MLFSFDKEKEALRSQARHTSFLLSQAIEVLSQTENRLHVLDLIADPDLSEELQAFSEHFSSHLKAFQGTLEVLSREVSEEAGDLRLPLPIEGLQAELRKSFETRKEALEAALQAARAGEGA